MAAVFSQPVVAPARMYFDLNGSKTRWQILVFSSEHELAVELLPGVFAVFKATGVRRCIKSSYPEVFELTDISQDREKIQDRLVSLGCVLGPLQEAQ